MDVLRRYLEAEKRKNPSQLRSKLLKDSPIQLDLEIETFLKDFSKRHSPKNFKDQTPRF
jgi:hypothetical protein